MLVKQGIVIGPQFVSTMCQSEDWEMSVKAIQLYPQYYPWPSINLILNSKIMYLVPF